MAVDTRCLTCKECYSMKGNYYCLIPDVMAADQAIWSSISPDDKACKMYTPKKTFKTVRRKVYAKVA